MRQPAALIGIEPAYLSKIEHDVFVPPSEAVIIMLAEELAQPPDVLLEEAGRLSSDLRDTIPKGAALFADLIRQLKNAPDDTPTQLAREIND